MADARVGERGREVGIFRSLHNRNYRLYFIGQMISMAGTFMQTVAQGWLVLKLTDSTTAVGLVISVQCLPMLLLGPMAGVLVDRSDRRKLWMLTQSLAGMCALTLGLVTIAGLVELWMVFVFALLLGLITTVDQTTKISLIPDLVGVEGLANAISLNSALNQVAKVIGPAVAGGVIAIFGIGPCFLLNACSFLGVIIGLAMMRPEEMIRGAVQVRAPRQVRDGLAFLRRTPQLSSLLLMSAVFFGMVWTFEVVLPGMAKFTFDKGPGLYGVMMSAIGIGSCIGALGVAHRQDITVKAIVRAGVFTGFAVLAAAAAPSLPIAILLLALVGGCGTTFMSTTTARLQTFAPNEMRGRVTAMHMVAAMGTRPIFSPILGWIGQHSGPRWALAAGGFATLFVALPLRWFIANHTGKAGAPDLSGPIDLPLAEVG